MPRKSKAELYTPEGESQYFQYFKDNLELARRNHVDGVSIEQLAKEYKGGRFAKETIRVRILKAHNTLYELQEGALAYA